MANEDSTRWRVRREGEGGEGRIVSWPRLIEGIENSVWEETDEAKSSGDPGWRLIGEHPQLEDYLPRKPFYGSSEQEDAEADMTPMIDVTFQLVIFFMIAATFTVQKTLDLPSANPDDAATRHQTTEELEEDNVMVTMDAHGTVTVAGETVALDELPDVLKRAIEDKGATEMVLDAHDDARHEFVVGVLDAAGAAQIEKVLFVQRAPSKEMGEE